MSTNIISIADMDKLSAFTNTLYERVNKQNEDERLYADLTGLYCDIIKEASKESDCKALNIFDYAKLLGQELQLYSAKEAYIMGLESKGISVDELSTKYQLEISDEKNHIENQIQNAYSDICTMLGSRKGLISDFTDVFRAIHGVIISNLCDFISLGQRTYETEG